MARHGIRSKSASKAQTATTGIDAQTARRRSKPGLRMEAMPGIQGTAIESLVAGVIASSQKVAGARISTCGTGEPAVEPRRRALPMGGAFEELPPGSCMTAF